MHIANGHHQHDQRDDGDGGDEVGAGSHCLAAITANMTMAMTMAHSISGAMISIVDF